MFSCGPRGTRIIKEHEGLRLAPYLCPAGVWTIGYGNTRLATLFREYNIALTQAQAIAVLDGDIADTESAVNYLVVVKIGQPQFDALVSFVYNVGKQAFNKSTLLWKLNQGQYPSAAAEFDKWIHGGGVVLPGLVRRRAAEKALFLEGVK